jgi:hypothetical protein
MASTITALNNNVSIRAIIEVFIGAALCCPGFESGWVVVPSFQGFLL